MNESRYLKAASEAAAKAKTEVEVVEAFFNEAAFDRWEDMRVYARAAIAALDKHREENAGHQHIYLATGKDADGRVILECKVCGYSPERRDKPF